MRIIHVVLGKANPDRMNGVNKVVHYLALHQTRSGSQVEVWGITKTPDAITPARDYNLKLFLQTKSHFIISDVLKQEIEKLPKDVFVHFHGALIPEYFLISRALLRKGIPWAITPHSALNLIALKRRILVKKVYIALIERLILGQAKFVHAICTKEADEISHNFKVKHICIIPNGVDLIDSQLDEIGCHQNDQFIVGYCGRLEKQQKGLDLLLDGFALYKKQGGIGRLAIIGDGKDRQELEETCQYYGIDSSVEFFGALFGDGKDKGIMKFDLFVHPSRWEGLPTAALEAAALGRPLLVSQETNLGEFITKWSCGMVLKTNESTQIANALKQFEMMKNSGATRNLGVNAIDMVKNEFNWHTIANQLIQAYQGGIA